MDSTTFASRLEDSFRELFVYIPGLLGAIIVLFAGYLLARLISRGLEKLLRRMRFNRLLEQGGILQAVERSGSHINPTRVAEKVMFWVVMFAVLVVASQALGFQSVTDVFSELLSYIPSVIAAVVVLVIGIVLGDFVGGLIMASAGGMHGGPALSRIGRGGVVVLAIFMALQQLGVATDIVTTAFAILFGAVALAAALAFGLGNRELAGEVMRAWYERYRAEREAIAREKAALDAADQTGEFETDAPATPGPHGVPLP